MTKAERVWRKHRLTPLESKMLDEAIERMDRARDQRRATAQARTSNEQPIYQKWPARKGRARG